MFINSPRQSTNFCETSLPEVDYASSASSQCYLKKNQVQKRTFIVINKSMVVKLQRTFVKFVTNIKTFNRPGVDVTNFIKLKTMKAVIVKMDKKEPDKATQPL